MIRRLNKKSDLKDLIKSCPSGVIDDIYAIEYYIQGHNETIQASFTKTGDVLEAILPSSDLETLPNGILMRRAFYKVLDASYPDGYYNLEFEDNLNVWLGEVESEEPVIPEYITEEELAETLEDYATTEDVTTAVSDLGGRISALENAGYITSAALSGYATEQWVGSQGYLTSTSLSDYATKSYVDDAISDIPAPENVVQYDVDHPLIEDFGLNVDVLKRNVFDHGTDVLTKGLVLSYQEYKVDDEVKVIDTIELRSNQLWKVNYDKTVDYHETRDPYVLQSNLSSYATQDWVGQQGYITISALSAYATQSWVLNQDYASDSDLDSLESRVSVLEHGGSPVTLAWGGISGTITDQTDLVSYVSTRLSVYATQNWVYSQVDGLASEDWVSQVALEGYATEQWVDDQGYITSSALSGYATESWATNQFLEESKVWTGTQTQWNQLTAEQKASYTIALITQ